MADLSGKSHILKKSLEENDTKIKPLTEKKYVWTWTLVDPEVHLFDVHTVQQVTEVRLMGSSNATSDAPPFADSD